MESLVPLFKCKSLKEIVDFYQALGFEITYQQEKPYLYGAVCRGDINLHFAKQSTKATCLVHVPEVQPYHRAFADALRIKYGRVPTADTPRITRFRHGQTRFHLFDPAGNLLLFINQDEPDIDYEAIYNRELSPIEQVLDNAAFLRDTYVNDKGAARVLDLALKRHSSVSGIERARILAARAEIAVAMGEMETAKAVQEQLKQIPISTGDYERFQDELTAADLLEQWILYGSIQNQSIREIES